MSYSDGDVQWMRAGRGVIHEEMWDLREADWAHKRIEIFQLWVNLPKKSKGLDPSLHHLKCENIPNVSCGNGVSVKVICGTLLDSSTHTIEGDLGAEITGPGSAVSESPVSILHLTMETARSAVTLNVEESCTVTAYVRRGSLMMTDREAVEGAGGGGAGEREVRAGDVVVFRVGASVPYTQRGVSGGSQGIVTLTAGPNGLGEWVHI